MFVIKCEPVFLCFQVGAIPANAVDDGQWSQGLISAVGVLPRCVFFPVISQTLQPLITLTSQARMVAAATNNLCEAANSAVQGHASEEKLISSAKQVAASTAQLLVACKVKADQDSQTMKRLQVSTCMLMELGLGPNISSVL